jgi:hypothetical protein
MKLISTTYRNPVLIDLDYEWGDWYEDELFYDIGLGTWTMVFEQILDIRLSIKHGVGTMYTDGTHDVYT